MLFSEIDLEFLAHFVYYETTTQSWLSHWLVAVKQRTPLGWGHDYFNVMHQILTWQRDHPIPMSTVALWLSKSSSTNFSVISRIAIITLITVILTVE